MDKTVELSAIPKRAVVCPKCHELNTGGRFCANCGAPLPLEVPETADPYIGRKLANRFLVHELLGGGGMGTVYRATDVNLEIAVALKIMNPLLAADPSTVQRFRQEAVSAARLNGHPNSIHIHDHNQAEGETPFIVMEYVPGRTLAQVIRDEFPLEIGRVIAIAAQILAVLEEAHAKKILHRDLKPENVIVGLRDGEEFIKVLDFGIARLKDSPRLTQFGMRCGTPGYMSPEQSRAEHLDETSDLFAVGILLYEMLTGKVPFDPDQPGALSVPPVPPHDCAPRIPSALESVVLRALSLEPSERPRSANEFRRALKASWSPSGPGQPSRPVPHGGNTEPWIPTPPPPIDCTIPAAPAPQSRAPTPARERPTTPAKPRFAKPPVTRPSWWKRVSLVRRLKATAAVPSAKKSLSSLVAFLHRTRFASIAAAARVCEVVRPVLGRFTVPALLGAGGIVVVLIAVFLFKILASPGRSFEPSAATPVATNVQLRIAKFSATTPVKTGDTPVFEVEFGPAGSVGEITQAGRSGTVHPCGTGRIDAGKQTVNCGAIDVDTTYTLTVSSGKTKTTSDFTVVVGPSIAAFEAPTPAPAGSSPVFNVGFGPTGATGVISLQSDPSARPCGADPIPAGMSNRECGAIRSTTTYVLGVQAAGITSTKTFVVQVSAQKPASRCTSARPDTPAASSGEGLLAVLVMPWADVWIDGTRLGETPCFVRLPAGSHRLRVTHASRRAVDEAIDLSAGESRRWTRTLKPY